MNNTRLLAACVAGGVLMTLTGCARTVSITNRSDEEFTIGSSADPNAVQRVLPPGGTMDLKVRPGQRISFEGLAPLDISVR